MTAITGGTINATAIHRTLRKTAASSSRTEGKVLKLISPNYLSRRLSQRASRRGA
jgi:hypothetical protein